MREKKHKSSVGRVRTVHSKIAQRRACSPLHFGVMAAEQEEDRIKGVA